MDFIDHKEDLFKQINFEASHLIEGLGQLSKHSDDLKKIHFQASQDMQRILDCANQIGGELLGEVNHLQVQLNAFFEQPSEALRKKIMQSALHIKQEAREI